MRGNTDHDQCSFRWLFIIEGIITLISAFLLLFFLPDYPARAKWLSPSDKQFAEDRLKERGGGYLRNHASKREVRETFLSPRMLVHYLTYVRLCPILPLLQNTQTDIPSTR